MSDDLVKQAREALNGVSKETWEIEWYICQADEGDVQHAKTRKLKRGETRRDLKVGDELWRVPTRIGPISSEHNHWSGTSLACNVADAMFVKEAHSLLPLMVDRIEELEKELEYWRGDSAAGWDKCEEYRNQLAKAVEALDEAIYLLDPDEEDIAKETGLHRIVTTLSELKGEK